MTNKMTFQTHKIKRSNQLFDNQKNIKNENSKFKNSINFWNNSTIKTKLTKTNL